MSLTCRRCYGPVENEEHWLCDMCQIVKDSEATNRNYFVQAKMSDQQYEILQKIAISKRTSTEYLAGQIIIDYLRSL